MTTIASTPQLRKPHAPPRNALYFPPDAQPILDLSTTGLTPNARLTLLTFWRSSTPLEEHVDRTLVRRGTGLDVLSFDAAVVELLRAGLVLDANEYRRAATATCRRHLDLVL